MIKQTLGKIKKLYRGDSRKFKKLYNKFFSDPSVTWDDFDLDTKKELKNIVKNHYNAMTVYDATAGDQESDVHKGAEKFMSNTEQIVYKTNEIRKDSGRGDYFSRFYGDPGIEDIAKDYFKAMTVYDATAGDQESDVYKRAKEFVLKTEPIIDRLLNTEDYDTYLHKFYGRKILKNKDLEDYLDC